MASHCKVLNLKVGTVGVDCHKNLAKFKSAPNGIALALQTTTTKPSITAANTAIENDFKKLRWKATQSKGLAGQREPSLKPAMQAKTWLCSSCMKAKKPKTESAVKPIKMAVPQNLVIISIIALICLKINPP